MTDSHFLRDRGIRFIHQKGRGPEVNPKFKGNVQGRKHPGRCAFEEPELCFRKPKPVAQTKEDNGHKNLINNHNYHDELARYQEISKRHTT